MNNLICPECQTMLFGEGYGQIFACYLIENCRKTMIIPINQTNITTNYKLPIDGWIVDCDTQDTVIYSNLDEDAQFKIAIPIDLTKDLKLQGKEILDKLLKLRSFL